MKKISTALSILVFCLGCASNAPKVEHEPSVTDLTIGCEVLDRDYTDYDQYKEYLPELGGDKIRLQAGWAKTEKVKGVYDFAWLDHIIDDAISRGLRIWLQTSYGNPIYEGGGTINLGGGMPTSQEAKDAWDNWVLAMARHYKGRVHEWELWNEPDLSEKISVEEIVDLNVRTARIIKSVDSDARIAGLALCVLNTELLSECMDSLKAAGALDLYTWISYHGYSYRPEDSYEGVEAFKAILAQYEPVLLLRQGENGAPSKGHMGGALDDYDWTELSQAKWDLRRIAGDRGHDVESSVFSIIDMAYPPGVNQFVTKMNVKGLIEADEQKHAVRRKLAFSAVQNYTSILKKLAVREDPSRISFQGSENCEYNLYTSAQGLPCILLWESEQAPLNTNTYRTVSLKVEGLQMKQPVWFDLLSGEVCELDSLDEVVIYDSPVVITEKENLLGCVNWLIDNEKAAFVTGITVPVDGGFLSDSGL